MIYSKLISLIGEETMLDEWYKQTGDRKTVKKKFICIACKQNVEHTMHTILVGTPEVPIFEYRTICSKCNVMRRLPHEPR